MDSVPYKFCEEVFGLMNIQRYDCAETAKQVTGIWKKAAVKYADNMQKFKVDVWKNAKNKWYCRLEGCLDMDGWPDDVKLPQSLAELFAIDRRFVRIVSVSVGYEYDFESPDYTLGGSIIAISKEDLVKKLIPFLNMQSAVLCSLSKCQFSAPSYYGNVAEYLKMFKRYVTFAHTQLSYSGRESEEFFEAQVKNNYVLNDLRFRALPDWPYSERTEDLLIELLRTRNKMKLQIIMAGLMLTMKTVKTIFKWWYESGKPIDIRTNTNVTEEDLLALPVPDDVSRTEERVEDEKEKRFLVRWRKEGAPELACKLVLEEEDERPDLYIQSPGSEMDVTFEFVFTGLDMQSSLYD
ncbi:hypothetical protein QR680_010719 [Steinernema hermaphroditum]|uniref:F-box domain-containing protein n=1 Tax=Steinernema hermaphroditum TaxID=289476 RepID=A0AA39ISC8_9BILA|nr:hypothetical protein QR680_010719 [Steinernema hermaphroditum]